MSLTKADGIQAYPYEVGKPYDPHRTRWDDRVIYEWRGEHELLMFASRPSEAEVLEVKRARVDLGLVVRGQLIVIVFRVGRFYNWSDAPYSYHLTPEPDRVLPPDVGPGDHVGMYLHLIDATSGILRANRWATMAPAFAGCLHESIRRQAAMPFDPARYNSDIAKLFAEYPSPRELLRIAVARCTLGED